MSLLEGRVAIVTGAGRGVGRAYALKMAEHGAKVVVNDLGSAATGAPTQESPAHEVVETIRAQGGAAVVDTSDVSDWNGAKSMIASAVENFGRLDVLVNNAGHPSRQYVDQHDRGRMGLGDQGALKGTFAPSHHAANHWRMEQKAGRPVDARIINTTSHSALFANPGQVNYAAAKAGIASFSQVAARELQRYGVTVNAFAPRANTRMTEGLREWTQEQLEKRDPEWIAAFVAWLASKESHYVSGRVFEVWGYGIAVAESWQHGPVTEASKDPAVLGPRIAQILKFARANAGIDRDTWLDP